MADLSRGGASGLFLWRVRKLRRRTGRRTGVVLAVAADGGEILLRGLLHEVEGRPVAVWQGQCEAAHSGLTLKTGEDVAFFA
jgi:hypothetical protein